MKQCCIIGGTGFIGSHIIQLLLSTDRRLTVIGRNQIPTRPLPKGVGYFAGDYGNKNFLTETLRGADEIIHLAYTSVPKTSFEDPVQDILDNLPETVNFLETASRIGVERIVLVSSGGTIYGKACELPITEDHPTNPISPYGISKLASEKYAMMFYELKSLPIICVRPGNAYGEGQRPFLGQGFVATSIVSILRDQEVILYGAMGTIRDYIHVTDVANGIIAALEYGKPGTAYNIGSGIGRSNKEVLDSIYPHIRSIGSQLRINVLPARKFDVPINILDSSKLTIETGWRAKMPFEEGIVRTFEWLLSEYKKS